MFTTPMIQLLAAVLDCDKDKVTEELLRQGAMHFFNVTEIESDWAQKISEVNPQVSLAKISEMRKRIDSLLNPLGLYPDRVGELEPQNRKLINLDEENKLLDSITQELQNIRERQRVLQQEILNLEDIKRQIDLYSFKLSNVPLDSKYSFISMEAGCIPRENLSLLNGELKDTPSVTLTISEDKEIANLFLIYMKRERDRVLSILNRAGWVTVELPIETRSFGSELSEGLDKKLFALRRDQRELEFSSNTLIEKKSKGLTELWAKLRINELFYRVQSYFRRTQRTVIFSGWLPSSKRPSLTEGIKKVTEGKCYLEWHEPKEVIKNREKRIAVPVQFRNPRFLAPFQMLVTNYGIPEYGTVDPTPFVMVSYLIMFGLMFSDVGQGFILFISGLLGMTLYKGKRESFKNLFKLILWCGLSSIVSGILLGGYFGFELFKPIWFDFHGIVAGSPQKKSYVNNIFGVLSITVYFGIAVILFGLLFNWINLFRKRHWVELIFDKGGMLGGWIYIGGIYIARYMISHDYRNLPPPMTMLQLVGLPALLLFFKGPVEFYMKRKEGTTRRFNLLTPMDFGMEWVVGLLEVFTMYLSNTLSFMRVAGLGIAHVSLMNTFFELARMANGGVSAPPYNPWYFIILISGNILVIGLEGLTAGIQSLRLNYYEFFTKFFRGAGEVYSPVSLKSRD